MSGNTPANTTFHFYWDANGIRWVGIPGWFHFRTNDTDHYVAISTWLSQSGIPYWDRPRNDIVDSRIYGVELLSPEDMRDVIWNKEVKPITADTPEPVLRTIVAMNEWLYSANSGGIFSQMNDKLDKMMDEIAALRAAIGK